LRQQTVDEMRARKNEHIMLHKTAYTIYMLCLCCSERTLSTGSEPTP